MVKSQFNKLLSKISVGGMQLRNRIVFGSHPTNFAKKNMLTDQHVAYYRERAKGGAGMIVLEEQLVHPSDLPYEKAPFGYEKAIVAGYSKIAEAVYNYKTVVVAQLNHSGMQSDGSTAMQELWAPSRVPDVVSREVPKAMEEKDIRDVVAGFARAAAHAVEGGLHGVEINAAQFSLIRQFMSDLTNHRGDAYGGDLNGRLRFCREVLQAVRQAMGPGKILGLRLCGDEYAPWGGLTPDDAVVIAKELEALQLLDYITVAVGSLFSIQMSWATYYTGDGPAVDVAAKVKAAVKLPVFAEGKIHRPEHAAALVEQGLVDGVYMNRALIADPELPAKLARDEADRVRGCLACNQGCQARRSMGKPLSCPVNSLVGVEAKTEKIKPAGLPKKVLVVGGGPGGMEAARIAAARGHQVTLWEAGPELGGQMLLNTGNGEVPRVLDYWRRELKAYKVEILLNKPCQPADVLAAAPDTVVVATGSRLGAPTIPVTGCPQMAALEALKNPEGVGDTVLFWDEIGDQLMARTVEALLAAGKKIYFITADLFAGNKLAATMELGSWNQRVMSGPAEIFTISKIKAINGAEAVIENKYSGESKTLTGIDTFVYNCWPKPDESLYLALKEQVREIYRVGDCLAPRGIGPAVREGYMAGRSI